MSCERHGFIVEVAGIDNPPEPPLLLATSPTGPGKHWCNFVPPYSHSCLSPHTLYSAEFTEQEARAEDWKLYLQVPGVETPLQVAPYTEEKAQDGAGVLPTDYKDELNAFQDYIFIPFRPVTAIRAVRGEFGYREFDYDAYDDGHAETKITCRLRLLRKGYLYIFRAGKFWREIMVFEDGAFTDIDLAQERPKRLARREDSDTIPQKGLAEEIWIPLCTYGHQKGDIEYLTPSDYQIAYSEHQWTWPYIEWLEQDEKRCNARMDSLRPLDQYLDNIENKNIPPRFNALIQATAAGGKFFPVEGIRPDLVEEAIGQASRLTRSAKWQKAAVADGHNPFADIDNDWELFKHIQGGEIPQDELPPEYDSLGTKSRVKPAKSVFGPGAQKGRALFFVNDHLYSPLFHAAKVMFYFNLLKSLDILLINKPYASVVWQMLNSAKLPDAYDNLVKDLDLHKVKEHILPAHRAAMRAMIQQSIENLNNCTINYTSSDSDYDLPGSHIYNTCDVQAVLRDLFTLEGAAYVSGWAWVKNIATALLTDCELADSCYRDYSNHARTRATELVNELEDWNCNGITLRAMLYPDPAAYPVDKPLGRGIALNNDGSGRCRFEELRAAIAEEADQDVRAHLYSIVSGVGTIFYQKYLEDIRKGQSDNPDDHKGDASSAKLSCHKKLAYTVNLLRITPGMKYMVLSSPDQLNSATHSILVKGLSYSPNPQNHASKKSYVAVRDEDGNIHSHIQHHIFQVSANKYVVCRTRPNKNAARYPLLVAQEGSPTLALWKEGVSAGAEVLAQVRIEFNMLFIVLSSLNLAVAREAYLADGNSDGLTLALSTTDAFVKFASGLLTAKTFKQALKRGMSVNALVGSGATLAARTLGGFLTAANVIGVVGSGYSAIKAFEQGDTASGAFYSGSAAALTAGIVCAVLGIITGGAGFLIAGSALGVLGVGVNVLGGVFKSEDLELELRQSHYGIKPAHRSPGIKDDNVLRLIKAAWPVTAKPFIQLDPQADHYAHLCALNLERNSFKRKSLRISWPLFTQPFKNEQIHCYDDPIITSLYLEDNHEMLLFTEYNLYKVTIKYNGEEFAEINEQSALYSIGMDHYVTYSEKAEGN